MLSVNIFPPESAIEALRSWLTRHCPGVAISSVFGDCGHFSGDCISVPRGEFDVWSDFLCDICQCESCRIIGLKRGACV